MDVLSDVAHTLVTDDVEQDLGVDLGHTVELELLVTSSSFVMMPLCTPTIPGSTIGWLFSFLSDEPFVPNRVWMMAARHSGETDSMIRSMNS